MGNLYVAFAGNTADAGIWRIGTDGTHSKLFGSVYDMGHLPDAMGYIYFRDTSNNLNKFHPSNPRNSILVEASISDMNTIAVHPKRRETIYFTKYTSGQIYEKTDKGSSSNVATGSGYTMHEMYADGTYLYIPLYNVNLQIWTINGWSNTTYAVSGNPSGISPYKGNTVLVTRDDDGVVVRGTNSASLGTLFTSPIRNYAIWYSPKRGTIFFGGSQAGNANQNWASNLSPARVYKPAMLRYAGADPVVNVTVSATVLSSVFSIPAYTPSATQNVTISQGVPPSVVASIPAYTVKVDVSTAPAVQSAVFSIPTYTAYANDVVISPAVQTATFSVPVYVADAVRNATISGTTPSATFSIPAYTVVTSTSVSASVQSATFSIPAFTTDGTQNVSISASTQALTFTIPAYQADAVRNTTISPSVQTLTFSTPSYTVVVIANITASPAVASATFAIPSYRITADFWQNKYPSSANTSWNNKY